MADKIRFFIGTDARGGCAECRMVLEWSIRKHCSVPFEIIDMAISRDPESFWHGWNTSKWSTPFSGFRYGIAEYCNFEGHVIYQDDDQMWLTDPAEFFALRDTIPEDKIMTGKIIPTGEIRNCVSLIDCAKWKHLPKTVDPVEVQGVGKFNKFKEFAGYCDYMKRLTMPMILVVDGNFNNYDGEQEAIEDIKVLHFTDMSTNPGVKLAVQRLGDQSRHWYDGEIRQHRRPDCVAKFMEYYHEALDAGMRVEDYIYDEQVEYIKQSQKHYRANNGFDVTLGQ